MKRFLVLAMAFIFFSSNLNAQVRISNRIPVAEIDKSKGIAFWKAKLLGVHTLLNYQWKVWESLPGGTKVTLTWNKDSCT
jgi:hypothetical protein